MWLNFIFLFQRTSNFIDHFIRVQKKGGEISLIIDHLFEMPQAKPKINYIDENSTKWSISFYRSKWNKCNLIYIDILKALLFRRRIFWKNQYLNVITYRCNKICLLNLHQMNEIVVGILKKKSFGHFREHIYKLMQWIIIGQYTIGNLFNSIFTVKFNVLYA